MNADNLSDSYGRKPIDALRLWRWGFAVVLVAVGLWLVWTAPPIGRASGRTVGWIMIGYAVVRTALAWLTGSRRQEPPCRGGGMGESA